MKLSHKQIAIIETAILLAIVGAILIWILFRGTHLGPISFITSK